MNTLNYYIRGWGIDPRLERWVLRVQIGKMEAKVLQWLGKRWLLPAEKAQAIEAELNAIGPERVKKLQNSSILLALPAMLGLLALLGFPFYQSRLTIFARVEDLVLTIPSGVELPAIIAIVAMAAILTQRMLITMLNARFKSEFPEHDLECLYYITDAIPHGPNGYKVQVDYFRLGRTLFKGSLVIYFVALFLSYLTSDWITETHYHKRSILPSLNETIAHEDLIYTYDPGKRQLLNIFLEDSGTLFLSHSTGRYGLTSETCLVQKVSEIEATRTAQTADGGLPRF